MEEVKLKLTNQQQAIRQVKLIQTIALVCTAVTLVIAIFFFVWVFTRPKYKPVKNDSPAITQLTKNNTILIKTVQDLTASINDKKKRDSLYAAQMEKTNALLSQNNNRLNQIDQQYEKSINAVNSFDESQLANYIAVEAARIRQGNSSR